MPDTNTETGQADNEGGFDELGFRYDQPRPVEQTIDDRAQMAVDGEDKLRELKYEGRDITINRKFDETSEDQFIVSSIEDAIAMAGVDGDDWETVNDERVDTRENYLSKGSKEWMTVDEGGNELSVTQFTYGNLDGSAIARHEEIVDNLFERGYFITDEYLDPITQATIKVVTFADSKGQIYSRTFRRKEPQLNSDSVGDDIIKPQADAGELIQAPYPLDGDAEIIADAPPIQIDLNEALAVTAQNAEAETGRVSGFVSDHIVAGRQETAVISTPAQTIDRRVEQTVAIGPALSPLRLTADLPVTGLSINREVDKIKSAGEGRAKITELSSPEAGIGLIVEARGIKEVTHRIDDSPPIAVEPVKNIAESLTDNKDLKIGSVADTLEPTIINAEVSEPTATEPPFLGTEDKNGEEVQTSGHTEIEAINIATPTASLSELTVTPKLGVTLLEQQARTFDEQIDGEIDDVEITHDQSIATGIEIVTTIASIIDQAERALPVSGEKDIAVDAKAQPAKLAAEDIKIGEAGLELEIPFQAVLGEKEATQHEQVQAALETQEATAISIAREPGMLRIVKERQVIQPIHDTVNNNRGLGVRATETRKIEPETTKTTMVEAISIQEPALASISNIAERLAERRDISGRKPANTQTQAPARILRPNFQTLRRNNEQLSVNRAPTATITNIVQPTENTIPRNNNTGIALARSQRQLELAA